MRPLPSRPLPSRPLYSLLACVLLACSSPPEQAKPKGDTPAPAASIEAPPPPAQEPDLSSFGLPGSDTAWSLADYSTARKSITAIAKQDPKLLPRDGSSTFARMADVDHLRELAGGLTGERLAGLTLALGAVHMVYGDQIRRDPTFDRETLILTAGLVAVTTRLPVTTIRTEADAELLRNEPSRLQGILRFRHGMFEMVEGMLVPEPKSTLPPSFACEQLARVIDDASPLLLEEERASLRVRVRSCEGEALPKLERALASEAPSAALVSVLLAEHREFAATK